jgi:hypothetical protein
MSRPDAADGQEILPQPDRRPPRARHDPDARVLGMTERDMVRLAARWWDRSGRHLMRAPDLRDPAVGLASGILRGLPWDELAARERQAVVLAHFAHKLRPRLDAAQRAAAAAGVALAPSEDER